MQSARAVLDRHLAQRQPGIQFDIEPLDAHAPGFAFFRGTQQDDTDPSWFYWVVRGDAVVTGDRDAALSDAYRALGVVEKPAAQDANNLAKIALALSGNETRLVDEDAAARLAPMFEGDRLHAPRFEPNPAGARLVFWDVSVGRGQYFRRYEVTVAPDYRVTSKNEQVTLPRKGG